MYMGVEENGAAAAPKRGIPQYRFHVIPRRAPMIPWRNPPTPKNSTKSEKKTTTIDVSENMKTAGKMINQELTLTRFNGAWLLKRLVTERPDLATSTKAVEWMLEKEMCVRAHLKREHGQLNAPEFIDNLGKTDYTFSFALNYAHMDRYPPKQKDDQDTVVREDECRMQRKVTMPMGPKQKNTELLNYGTIDATETTIGYKTLN